MKIEPLSRPPHATVRVPGSKSITNRALVCAALAEGTSELPGLLVADDTEAMMSCLRALGAEIEGEVVRGTGGRLRPGPITLDARQAGTVARFLPPVVAAFGSGSYTIDGHPQLRARPMGPMIDALRDLGVTVAEDGEPGHLPFTVTGRPSASKVALRGDVSSQYVSGLLLASIDVEVTTALVSEPYVAMTRAVVDAFAGGARTFPIEPDASAASYFFAAATICEGRVRVEGLGKGSLQGDLRFVALLAQMGAQVTITAEATEVEGTGALHGIEANLRDLSDTAPTLAVTAVFADSPTRLTGIGFVRGKESDRIGAVVGELRRCGIDAREEPDGFTVYPGTPQPATVQTHDDHRLAMAFALLGLRVDGIDIADPECVAKTFPDYFSVLDTLRR